MGHLGTPVQFFDANVLKVVWLLWEKALDVIRDDTMKRIIDSRTRSYILKS